MSNIAPKKQKSKTKRPKIYAYFKRFISNLDYGLANSPDKVPFFGDLYRPNTTKKIENFLSGGKKEDYVPFLKNDDIEKAFQGTRTAFYSGNGNPNERYTLFSIDVDTKKGINQKTRSKNAAGYLQNYFPHSWANPSRTTGYNLHIKVDKGDYESRFTAEAFNCLLNKLQVALTKYNDQLEAKLEIKGTCPTWDWETQEFTCGQLIGFPKLKTDADKEAFMALPIYTIDDLYEIIDRLNENAPAAVPQEHSYKGGSILEFNTIDEKVLYHCKEYADHLVATHNTKISAVLLGEFIFSCHFFRNDPNEDGTLPGARVLAFHKSCYQSGFFKRSLRDTELATLRNFMVDLGLIDMIDPHYSVIKGQAMKWQCGDQLYNHIEAVKAYWTTKKVDSTSSSSLSSLSLSTVDLTFIESLVIKEGPRPINLDILPTNPLKWRLMEEQVMKIIKTAA